MTRADKIKSLRKEIETSVSRHGRVREKRRELTRVVLRQLRAEDRKPRARVVYPRSIWTRLREIFT